MRFLYITTIGTTMGFFPPLIHELLSAGCVVDIAANENGGETPVPGCYRAWGCRVFPLSCSRSPLDRRNLSAIKEIRRLVQAGAYDIVHCHTPVAAACTRIACRGLCKSGVKVFYTAHGFHFYSSAPMKNWLLYYPVEWLCAHWTDVLITINKEDFARAKRRLPARRTEYVPGVGIDVDFFANTRIDRAVKRRELGIPENALLLLSVGELNANKNHETIIKALPGIRAPHVHYAIAGDGDLKTHLRALVSSLHLDDRVHILGRRADVAALYKAADIFVFPSRREGLPVSLMEVMAAGLPIVAARIRGVTDLLAGSGNPLIERCCDTDAYARAIDAVAADPKLQERLSRENRIRAEAYDTAKINARMKSIYGIE